jgi:hypothetical protein
MFGKNFRHGDTSRKAEHEDGVANRYFRFRRQDGKPLEEG